MTDEIDYQNNPLHGVGLKTLLTEMVDHYGFEILFAYLNINCFKTNPSIESSIKFLKKTEWAREKVESFYLYEYKNLPRASAAQFELTPRMRIIPRDQQPGEPAELSLEDAARLQAKRAKKAASFGHRSGGRARTGKNYGGKGGKPSRNRDGYRARKEGRGSSVPAAPRDSQGATGSSDDPWANWKK